MHRLALYLILGFMFISALVWGASHFSVAQADCPLSDLAQRFDILTIEATIANCGPSLIDAAEAQKVGTEGADRGYLETLIGLAYVEAADYFNARTALGRAIAAYVVTEDYLMQAMTRYYFGRTYTLERRHNDAQVYYAEAEGIARRYDLSLVLGRVLYERGQRAYDQNQYETTIAVLEEALDNLLQHPEVNEDERTQALSNLSDVYTRFAERNTRSSFDELGRLYRSLANVSPFLEYSYAPADAITDGTCSIDDVSALQEADLIDFERALPGCGAQLSTWAETLNTLRLNAEEPQQQAFYNLLYGLVLEAQGGDANLFTAQGRYGQALALYRQSGSTEMAARALVYLAFNYLARGQINEAEAFMGQATNERSSLPIYQGRVRYGLALLQAERGIPGDAVLTAETALDTLREAGDLSLIEQRQVLIFLATLYGQLRDSQKVQETNERLASVERRLFGEREEDALAEVNICVQPERLFEVPLIVAERGISGCDPTQRARLILIARVAANSADSAQSRGRARLYLGIGYYLSSTYEAANAVMGRAIDDLNEVSDWLNLGVNYYYLSLSYLNFTASEQVLSDQYLADAIGLFERSNDNYYLARGFTEQGQRQRARAEQRLDGTLYTASANSFDQALVNYRVSVVASCNEQRYVLDQLVALYASNILANAVQQDYYSTLRSSVCTDSADDFAEVTPEATDEAVVEAISPQPTAAPPIEVSACDADAIVAEREYLVFEALLLACPDVGNDVLQLVETEEAQAADDEAIAHAKLRLGLVLYAIGEPGQAVVEFERAFTRFRDALGDSRHHGLSLFYGSRALQAQMTDQQWLDLRRAGTRPPILTKADTYLNEARRVSAAAGDTLTQGRIEAMAAERLNLSGDTDGAIEAYEAALSFFNQSEGSVEGVETRLVVADIRYQRGEYEESQALYRLVVEADDVATADQLIRALLGIARHEKYYGRFESAMDYATQAEARAETLADRVRAQAEQADIAREAGDLRAARAIVQLYENHLFDLSDCQDADLLRLYTGYYYISLGNGPQARVVLNDIVSGSCEGRQPLDVAKALSGLAEVQLLRRSGDADTNIAVEIANREFDALDNQPGYISARLQQARYHQLRREWDEANTWLASAEERATAINDLRGLADVTMTRVDINIERGQYSAALNLLAQGTNYYNAMGHELGTINSIEARLRINIDQANFTEALSIIDEARSLNTPLSFDSRIQYYEGRLAEIQGQSEVALTLYTQSSAGFQELGEALNRIEVDLRIARVYQQRGELDAAQALTAIARTTAVAQENPFYIGQAEALLADTLVLAWQRSDDETSRADLIDQAITAYLAALAAYEEAGNVVGQADVYNQLGEYGMILLENNPGVNFGPELGGPSQNFQRALERYRIIGNSFGMAEAHNNLGRYHGFVGEYDLAHSNFNTALSLLDADAAPYLQAEILINQGLVFEYQHYAIQQAGNINATEPLRSARDNYESAAELVNFVYGEISDDSARRAFGSQELFLLPYSRLVRMLSLFRFSLDPEEDTALLLQYAEQSRARSYLFALQDANFAPVEGNADVTRWLTLRDEIISLRRQLDEVRATTGDAGELSSTNDAINIRLAELQSLQDSLSGDGLRQFIDVETASLAAVQASLPEGTALVSYYIVEGLRTRRVTENPRLIITVIDQNGAEVVPLRVDDLRVDIDGYIETLHNAQGQAPDAVSALEQQLIQPISTSISRYDTLVFVPFGKLNYLPFDVFSDADGNYLIENHDIAYAPSATVYTLLQGINSEVNTDSEQMLMMTYSGAAFPNLVPLIGIELEYAYIAGVVPNLTYYPEEEAQVANLSTSLVDADILHFAAHGVFDGANALASYIALAPDAPDHDGRLTVTDIYALSLDNAPLVTISACQLAFSELSAGDELEGMIRAFLFGGARGVVASLWNADDFATAELMEAFYRYRSQGQMSEVAALSQAKRDMALMGRPVAEWSGFVLIGGTQQ